MTSLAWITACRMRAAFSAGLAFWYGKDAFKTLMNTWGKCSAPKKRTKKKS